MLYNKARSKLIEAENETKSLLEKISLENHMLKITGEELVKSNYSVVQLKQHVASKEHEITQTQIRIKEKDNLINRIKKNEASSVKKILELRRSLIEYRKFAKELQQRIAQLKRNHVEELLTLEQDLSQKYEMIQANSQSFRQEEPSQSESTEEMTGRISPFETFSDMEIDNHDPGESQDNGSLFQSTSDDSSPVKMNTSKNETQSPKSDRSPTSPPINKYYNLVPDDDLTEEIDSANDTQSTALQGEISSPASQDSSSLQEYEEVMEYSPAFVSPQQHSKTTVEAASSSCEEQLHDISLPELTHEAIYSSLESVDKEVKASLERKFKGLQLGKTAKKSAKILGELVDELNQEKLPVPQWPEVMHHDIWSTELVEYAVFRLQIESSVRTPCSFFGLLKPESHAYIYVLLSIVKGTLEKPQKTYKHPLQNLQIPQNSIFKTLDKKCQKAHSNFFMWYIDDNVTERLNSRELFAIMRVLEPSSREYRRIITIYLTGRLSLNLIKNDEPWIITDEQKGILSTAAYQLNTTSIPLPEIIAQKGNKKSWDLISTIDLMTAEGFEINQEDAHEASNHFKNLQRAGDHYIKTGKGLHKYKAALRAPLDSTSGEIIKSGLRRYALINKHWKLPPIPGTYCWYAISNSPKIPF